jgi:starch synthase
MPNTAAHPPPREKNVVVVAAEDADLPEGKVGGVGDAVARSSEALAELGLHVTIVVPSSGIQIRPGQPGTRLLGRVRFRFRTGEFSAELYQVEARPGGDSEVCHLVLVSPLFANPGGRSGVYYHDPDDRPFATDANKFAAFCSAVAAAINDGLLGPIDILHTHDWPTGLLHALIAFDEEYARLRGLQTVHTVDNIALQGIRPFRSDDVGDPNSSCFEEWFPWLVGRCPVEVLADPRWAHCVNPLRAGIKLAKKVHLVAPSSAREVLRPSLPEKGFGGGEGLEGDLRARQEEGALVGILNGLVYPAVQPEPRRDDAAFRAMIRILESEMAGAEMAKGRELVLARLAQWRGRGRPAVLTTAVTRVSHQKISLMLQPGRSDPRPALERILDSLDGRGLFLLLGSGLAVLEDALLALARRHERFLFLNAFSEAGADQLYANGDIFMMPSSYEPGGISQLNAMLYGQPCVAHAVGGLKDTIRHGIDGLLFEGDDPAGQADAFVAASHLAVILASEHREAWTSFSVRARAARFPWADSALQYVRKLYA